MALATTPPVWPVPPNACVAATAQAKDGGLNAATSEHLNALAPHVLELATLERRAQHSFLLGLLYQANGGALPQIASAGASSPPAHTTKRPIKEADADDDDDDRANAPGADGGAGKGGARGSGKHRRHRGRGGGRG